MPAPHENPKLEKLSELVEAIYACCASLPSLLHILSYLLPVQQHRMPMAAAKVLPFLCLVVLFAAASSFRLFAGPARLARCAPLRLSDSDAPKFELVPVDKVNTVNAAAVSGGFVGFVVGGPIFGVALAAISNYVAKNENESGEALRGFGKVVVETYNFLNKLNAKYNLTGKAAESVSNLVNSAAADNETLEKVKTTYTSAVEKLDEINKEYDLVTKGKEVVVAAATLSDAAIEKVIELNEKVRFCPLDRSNYFS